MKTMVGRTVVQGTPDIGFAGNVQFGILFKYADQCVDFYVYPNEATFKGHASQFVEYERTGGGKILWSSQPIK